MRREELFVEYLGPSLNAVLGAKSKKTGKHVGVGLYIGAKKAAGNALLVAGVKHIEPFCRPVELWFYPRVEVNAGRKEYDCLNFGIVYKILEDWLVKTGVIGDDNREWVRGAHCMRSEPAPDGVPGILVVIQEVDAPAIGHQADISWNEPAAVPF